MGYLIDTCIWIDVERGNLSPADIQSVTGSEPVFISPVTLAELTFGTEMADSDSIRIRQRAATDRLRKKPCLRIDEETGIIFGSLAAQLRRQGRGAEFRIQDSGYMDRIAGHTAQPDPADPN